MEGLGKVGVAAEIWGLIGKGSLSVVVAHYTVNWFRVLYDYC